MCLGLKPESRKRSWVDWEKKRGGTLFLSSFFFLLLPPLSLSLSPRWSTTLTSGLEYASYLMERGRDGARAKVSWGDQHRIVDERE